MSRITFGDWHYVNGFGLRADTFKNNHRIGTTERNHNGYIYFEPLGNGVGFSTVCSTNIVTLAQQL